MNEEKSPEAVDPSKVNPSPPSREEIEHAIKTCAMIAGQTKAEIEKLIKETWLYGHPERIKNAMTFLWTLFDGKERMPRRVVRAGRKENGLTFAQILKRKLNPIPPKEDETD